MNNKLFMFTIVCWAGVVVSTITVKATKRKRQDDYYTIYKWRVDISNMFGRVWGDQTAMHSILARLEKINDFEQKPQFPAELTQVNISSRVSNYFHDTTRVSAVTTLLRKTKFLSRNMIEILTGHNGCSYEEMFKYLQLVHLFEDKTRLRLALEMSLPKQMELCWSYYNLIMRRAVMLMSSNELERIGKLPMSIDSKALDDFVKNGLNSDEASIELLASDIAKFILALDHPDLETIEPNKVTETQQIVSELYKIELQDLYTKFCDLVEPVDQYFSGLEDLVRMDRIKLAPTSDKIVGWRMQVQFGCNIASVAYSSLSSKIWKHFVELKAKKH